MDKEAIAKMQTTLAGAKTQAEGIKSGLVDVGKDTAKTNYQTILDVLTKKALADSGAVSSKDTGVGQMYKDAAASAEAVRAAGASRISMEAEEGATAIRKAGAQRLTSAEERRGAMGFNPAALKAIQDNTKTELADLDKRKDQALLENNTALVDKINNLQLKAIDFQQKAEQQQFSNILGLGGFAIKVMEEERKAADIISELKPAEISTFIDENGDVVAKNKLTGETLWVAKGIGRAGLDTSKFRVKPIANPITGNYEYTEFIDEETGEIKYLDKSGEEVDASEVQIEEEKDPYDIFIKAMMSEMLKELI